MGSKRVTNTAKFIYRLCIVGLFAFVWFYMYNRYTFNTYRIRGGLVSVLLFYLIYSWLCGVYRAYRIASSSIGDIIFKQFISFAIADFILYMECCLIYNQYVNIIPGAITVVGQLICTVIITFVTKRHFIKSVTPKKTLVIYGKKLSKEDAIAFEKRLLYKYDHLFQIVSTEASDIDDHTLDQYMKVIDSVIFYEVEDERKGKFVVTCLRNHKNYFYTPQIDEILATGTSVRHLLDTPLMKYDYKYQNKIWLFEKRVLDIIFSLIFIIITSPIMLITAILIKFEDGGPVFFKQKRHTKDMKVFEILKFRSMKTDAERYGAIPATQNDPRITKVGRFIRKVRIDELPQFFNILKGDMSFVGPRPERVEHTEMYSKELPEFALRLRVKGGLTGYAQVFGKYNTSSKDKLLLDLMYIEDQSLLNDLKLLLLTVRTVFEMESTEGFNEAESARMNKVMAGQNTGLIAKVMSEDEKTEAEEMERPDLELTEQKDDSAEEGKDTDAEEEIAEEEKEKTAVVETAEEGRKAADEKKATKKKKSVKKASKKNVTAETAEEEESEDAVKIVKKKKKKVKTDKDSVKTEMAEAEEKFAEAERTEVEEKSAEAERTEAENKSAEENSAEVERKEPVAEKKAEKDKKSKEKKNVKAEEVSAEGQEVNTVKKAKKKKKAKKTEEKENTTTSDKTAAGKKKDRKEDHISLKVESTVDINDLLRDIEMLQSEAYRTGRTSGKFISGLEQDSGNRQEYGRDKDAKPVVVFDPELGDFKKVEDEEKARKEEIRRNSEIGQDLTGITSFIKKNLTEKATDEKIAAGKAQEEKEEDAGQAGDEQVKAENTESRKEKLEEEFDEFALEGGNLSKAIEKVRTSVEDNRKRQEAKAEEQKKKASAEEIEVEPAETKQESAYKSESMHAGVVQKMNLSQLAELIRDQESRAEEAEEPLKTDEETMSQSAPAEEDMASGEQKQEKEEAVEKVAEDAVEDADDLLEISAETKALIDAVDSKAENELLPFGMQFDEEDDGPKPITFDFDDEEEESKGPTLIDIEPDNEAEDAKDAESDRPALIDIEMDDGEADESETETRGEPEGSSLVDIELDNDEVDVSATETDKKPESPALIDIEPDEEEETKPESPALIDIELDDAEVDESVKETDEGPINPDKAADDEKAALEQQKREEFQRLQQRTSNLKAFLKDLPKPPRK